MAGRTSGNRKQSQRREREIERQPRAKNAVTNYARFGGTYIEFVVQTRQLRVEVILVKLLSDAAQQRGTHRAKGDKRGKGTAAFGEILLRRGWTSCKHGTTEGVKDARSVLLGVITPAATIQSFVERILTPTATVLQNAPISQLNVLSSA